MRSRGVWFCWLVLHVSLLWGDCGSFVDLLWEGTTIMVLRLSIFWGALGLTKNGAWSSIWLEELDENSSGDQLLASFSGFWFDCSRAWRLTSCDSIPLFISSLLFCNLVSVFFLLLYVLFENFVLFQHIVVSLRYFFLPIYIYIFVILLGYSVIILMRTE